MKTTIEKLEYCRKYREKNRLRLREKHKVYSRNWRRKNVNKIYPYMKAWRDKYPERVSAKRAVYYALKTGKIKKSPCVECNDINSVGHHPDYSQKLFVIWLCRAHHRQLHYGE